jgi:hypothetical protein
VSFRSKQNGRWAFIDVSADHVRWTDRFAPPPGW